MQPPPRKVKPAVALKNIHADQVSKLQGKHQQECDLLEDIRTFFSRKAALEKEYAQGLQKVTSQLLKRDFPAQPDLHSEDGLEHKTVCTVWRSILEEADRMAKARLQAADVYAEKVAEPLKPAKTGKMQTLKKILPQLTTIQAEVSQCVMDMVKSSKAYTTENGIAHDARQKSLEAEDKLKRKSTGIFQSLAGLQKNAAKLRARTETSEVKETTTRNDYLINLAAANAHHIRYYSTDLPEIMKTMDCEVYEKIQESLTVAGQTAAEIAQAETSSFQNIAVEAAKICRQFSHQCYLFQNPVFTNLVQYQFEPSHEDTCNTMSSDHGAGPELEKEARKWATRTAKETRSIRDYYRQLTVLQNSKTADKTSDSGSQENTNTDPDVKLEEIKQHIRKAETAKLKAEARLEALKSGGVNVDEWISQAQMESLAAEESGLARTPSQLSLRTESSGGHSIDDQEATYTNYDDDDDFIDDPFNTTSVSRSDRTYPIYCKALYDFEASNYDEMCIKTGEDLELIADGDGEGWIKAKNSLGQEGYIPETYVEQQSTPSNEATTPMASPPSNNNTATTTATNNSNNFTSSSARSSTSSQHSSNAANTGPTSPPDVQSPTSVDFTQDTTSSYSSGDLEVQQTTEVMASNDLTPVAPTLTSGTTSASDISWAKALYDYDGQTDEELSFLEGTLIKVLRKDDNGVDDGFWEGECNGSVGVFPSLVVEEIGTFTPNDPTSPGSYVDYTNPPPVHITLPTPDGEPPSPPPTVNGEECEEPLPPLPPPPVLELEDVDQFESAQDAHPAAPPPLVDTDQNQLKRVRFHTMTNASYPYPSNPSKNDNTDGTQPHTRDQVIVNNHRTQTSRQQNLQRLAETEMIKLKREENATIGNPSHEHNAVTVTHNPMERASTPSSSLSRHQSLPNCNTPDNVVTRRAHKSPLPLRSKSKSMTLTHHQHQHQDNRQIPSGAIPPPPQHTQRKNERRQNEIQLNKVQPAISNTRSVGPAAHIPNSQISNSQIPNSQNFVVDKIVGSPPLSGRKSVLASLPPPRPPPPTTLTRNANTTDSNSHTKYLQTLKQDSTTKSSSPSKTPCPDSPVKSPTHQNTLMSFPAPSLQQQQYISQPKTTTTMTMQQQPWNSFPSSNPHPHRHHHPPQNPSHRIQHSQEFTDKFTPQNQHNAKTQNMNGSWKNSNDVVNNSISYHPQPFSNPSSPQQLRHHYQQQQQQQQLQHQHHQNNSPKGLSYSRSLTRRQDKLPLCFDVDGDDWESDEGEVSLV